MKIKNLLLAVLTMLPICASAYDFEVDGICYDVLSSTDLTCSVASNNAGTYYSYPYSSYEGDIIIPSTVEYDSKLYKVVEVSDYAFRKCSNLTSVQLPEGVTKIGHMSFEMCSGLVSVQLPSTLTRIENSVFEECTSLRSIEIPEGVTHIGNYMFQDDENLETVVLPSTLATTGFWIFYNCKALKSVNIPKKLTAITNYMFYNCVSLEEIDIHDNISSFGYSAFENCSSLREIYITAGISDIENKNPFGGCTGLLNINVHPDNSLYKSVNGALLSKDGTKAIKLPCGRTNVYEIPEGVVSLEYGAIANNACFSELVIPTTLRNASIGYSALTSSTLLTFKSDYFMDKDLRSYFGSDFRRVKLGTGVTNVNLSSTLYRVPELHIASTVQSINYSNFPDVEILDIEDLSILQNINIGAFSSSKNKTLLINGENKANIIIPDGVEHVNLTGYTNLEEVTLGKDVKDVCLYRCSNLTTVNLNEGLTTIEANGFRDCTKLSTINLPSTVTSIGESAFYNCTNLNITGINEVTSLGVQAFYNCKKLESISIADGVTIIGDNAFFGCASLAYVSLPNTITSIGASAFSGCTFLENITLPNLLTSIGASAFSGCTSLENITLPNLLTSIGASAFKGCSKITEISLPASLTTLGGGAFSGCDALATVRVDSNVLTSQSVNREPTTGTMVIANHIKHFILGENITNIGDYAFKGCSELESIHMPETIESIGKYAFSGCSSLESIHMPESVETIGEYAFTGCNSLPWIEGARYADTYLVEADNSLERIVIKDGTKWIGSQAFYSFSSLKEVVMPNSIVEIQSKAFQRCTSLESIYLPENLLRVGDTAFSDCTSLEKVEIADIASYCNITFLGISSRSNPLYSAHHLFVNGKELTEITIPNGVTKINQNAFAGGSYITDVTLPSSLTEIANSAFSGCAGINNFNIYSPVVPTIKNGVFTGINGEVVFHVLKGMKDSYLENATFSKYTIIDDLILPETITLGASDYSTYCSDANLDFSEVDGLKAYIASSFNPSTGALTITRVDNVPAGEGILLKGTAGESYEVPTTDETSVVANLMVGTTTATTLYPTDSDKTNFVLTKNAEDQMGFYRFSGSVNMPANKAWLQIPTSAISSGVAAKGFTFVEEGDELTGIADVVISNDNHEGMFDLQGRKLTASPASGIYIMNGKKYVK